MTSASIEGRDLGLAEVLPEAVHLSPIPSQCDLHTIRMVEERWSGVDAHVLAGTSSGRNRRVSGS
jgi:hypothetical protein